MSYLSVRRKLCAKCEFDELQRVCVILKMGESRTFPLKKEVIGMPDTKNVSMYSFSDVYYAVYDEKTETYSEQKPLKGILGISFDEITGENQSYIDLEW